jgi:hypothetical protein
MTRRISPRSAIAAGDPDLARLAVVDLAESSRAPVGVERPRSLRELARLLVPMSFVPDSSDRPVSGWVRSAGRARP